MIEYVFFHKHLADAFVERLAALSIHYREKDDELGFIVAVPEDLGDDLIGQLDDFSEALLAQSEDLLNTEGSGTEKQAAAINITLRDGRVTQASVRPELMNKLLSALSFEEVNELVEVIVDSIENPDDRPFCQR